MVEDRVLYEGKPSKRLFWSWAIKATIIVIVCILFLVPILMAENNSKMSMEAVYFNLFFCLLIYCLILIFLKIQLNTYKYKITDKGVHFIGGFLTKREKFVPFYKITNVDILQTLVDQMFGVKRLGFQTAGQGASNFPEITFQGLENADKPKEITLKMIEKTSH